MQLRGALFKKLVVKEPSPKTRTGQALYLLKKNGRYLKFHIQPTRRLIKIPIDPNIVQNGVTYPLIEPYAYARIFYDTKEEQFIYSTRKKALGPFKKDIVMLPLQAREAIAREIELKFEFLFERLNVMNTKDVVSKYTTLKRVISRKRREPSKPVELSHEGAD